MNRRTLLKWTALYAAALPFALYGKEAKGAKQRHLILIELKGGNDGLNTLIPYSDPLYYRLRPKIAIPKKELLPLNDSLALHPSMGDMKKIYESGDMAIIQGVGYPDPNRSHFRSIEIWDTASNSNEYLDSGWLESLNPKEQAKLQAIILGGEYGPLSGAERGIIKINNIQGFLNQSRRIHAQIYMTGDNDALTHILKTEAEIRQSADILSRYFDKNRALPYPFAKGNFGRQLKMTAQLIQSGIDTPFFKLSLGSFDTHINQKPKQARLLKQLSEGIAALRQNLIESGKWKDTVIMTYSEFGRRAAENASRGTDHGTAAPHFVIGGSIKGGLYGDQPPLEHLDKNGDLVYTTDFRALYRTVAEDWLGRSSTRLKGFDTLPLF